LVNQNNVNNTFQSKKLRTPYRTQLEMYGKVIQLMGVNNVKIMCEDGVERNCRIPGKMFKHIWIKPSDIVIIKLWDFQPSKADVVWRYLGFQKSQLERKGELTKLYEFTFDDINLDAPTTYTNYKNKK
jgi:translation initiation factor 1A